MKRIVLNTSLLVVLVLTVVASARAQAPAAAPTDAAKPGTGSQPANAASPPAPPEGEKPAPSSAQAPPLRDPTVPGANLQTVIDRSGRSMLGPARPATVKMPAIVLRGRIQVADKPLKAMIEIGTAGIYLIEPGASLTVRVGTGEEIVVQVSRLTLEEIEIEIPSLHQKVVIR